MEIVHLTAELTPIAKAGGLGDVIGGLSHELIKKGEIVEVVLPKYDTLPLHQIDELQIIESDFSITFEGREYSNSIWRGRVDKIPIILLESEHPKHFFKRGKIYGESDDIDRFGYFSLLAFEYLKKKKRGPFLLHIHDWHPILALLLLKSASSPFYDDKIKTLLTIHNFAYQGWCTEAILEKVGLLGAKHGGTGKKREVNLLKEGVLKADWVTTVSPQYAHEVVVTEEGRGLQKALQTISPRFSGILNGIDYHYWNPSSDPFLPFHFSLENKRGKKQIQSYLRKMFSLEEKEAPLIGAVTRLVPQKGPGLLKAGIERALQKGGQCVLLGSSFDPQMEEEFLSFKKKWSSNHNIHIELGYDEKLAHLIYAASDLFLLPSLFEPCGLSQMIAMRYGTIPLVRATGGLINTVFDGKNGFLFSESTKEAMEKTLDRALLLFLENPKEWNQMMEKAMSMDFSWVKPAEEYLKIYLSLLGAIS